MVVSTQAGVIFPGAEFCGNCRRSRDSRCISNITAVGKPQEGRTCARVYVAIFSSSIGSGKYLPDSAEYPVPAWALYLAECFPTSGRNTGWSSHSGDDLQDGAKGDFYSPPGDRGPAGCGAIRAGD